MAVENKIKIGLICLLIITIVLSGCINEKVGTNNSTGQHEERKHNISESAFVDYLQLAKETGNYSYCDKLSNETNCHVDSNCRGHMCQINLQKCLIDFTPKEKCYLTLIKQSPKVEVCKGIPQGKYYMGAWGPRKTLRDQCFYVISIETNNSPLCNEIENDPPKSMCLYHFNMSNEN